MAALLVPLARRASTYVTFRMPLQTSLSYNIMIDILLHYVTPILHSVCPVYP